MRRTQLFHALQRLDPALRLAGLGRLSLEAGNVLFHVRALRLLLFVGLLLLGQAFGASAFEGRVAAAIQVQLALLDMGNMVNHGVEKITVVGDQQQGARVALQPAFEPENRVQIQVVGWLVEQQQVGRAHQRLGQVQAHTPATGEVADAAIHLRVLEAQASQQLARAGIGGITVGAVQFTVQAGNGGAVVALLGCGQLGLHAAQVVIAVEHVVNGQPLEVVDLLAHMGDTPVAGQQAIAGIRCQLTAQQGEQAGFTGAVGTDQTGLVTGVQGQLGAFEQALRTTL